MRKRCTGEKTKVPEEVLLSIRLLGPLEVSFEGRRTRFERKKTLALLCYLAAEGGKRSRGELAELLWPQSDERRARTDLRSTLTRLRKTLWEELQARIGEIHERRGEVGDAREAFSRAAQILRMLAHKIEDEKLKEGFLAASQVRCVLGYG